MRIKKYLFLVVLLWVACSNIEKTNNKEVGFKLVERVNVETIQYDPLYKDKYNEYEAPDLYFSRELLRSLDDSIAEVNYRIMILDEIIAGPLTDTFPISIYQFESKGHNERVSKLFNDSSFEERFIGIYNAPIRALYFTDENSLYAVCRKGVEHETDLKNKEFKDYVIKTVKSIG